MTKQFSMVRDQVFGLVGMGLMTLPVMATPVQSLVISEVFYDRTGADGGFEWVELYNGTPAPVDLSEFSLGFGGTDYASATLGLSGLVEAGAYFVLGGPQSDATNGAPIFDLVVDFAPDLQNAGSTADGVGLFDSLENQISALSIPLDAVVYGALNDNQLIGADGLVSPPDVGDAPSGSSIVRISPIEWMITSEPRPGVGALDTTALPAPATLALFAIGLCFLPVARINKVELE